MAQSLVIGLLLVMAAIAGAVCVWLFIRGLSRGAAAPPTAAPVSIRAAERGAPAPAAAVPPPRAAAPVGPLETQVLSLDQTFHNMYELAFGALAHQKPPQQELRVVAENADELFERLATDPKYVMRRPMMLPQLLRAVHDKKSTQHQLANIFARDPALAGNLLKVANSPVYRVSEDPVESLDRAVAMLGTDGLHSLIATVLVQPVFKLAATDYPRFPEIVWEHTFRSASAAESHASQVENGDPFAAQLLALTMGLGTIVVYRLVVDRCHLQLQGRSPHPAVIIALIDSQCASVAKRVAASWELSERVLTALEEQRPRRKGEPVATLSPLGRSLAFGRKLAALAVLHEHGLISEDTVRASMALEGPLAEQFDSIWIKLIGHEERAKA
ncbi:MAG TPA: HDOD domain-containing protein [Steroidobacteraceae bacterium]|jgi:HD-like signal output (HDOD) protein